MHSTTRYILYARKSTDTEDRQVQSLADQIAELTALAKRHNLRIVHEMFESHSAKLPGGRPVFEEMLRMLEAGEADGILCWHLNRLSRNPVDSGRLSWLLQREVIHSIQTIDRQYLPTDNVMLFAVESGKANQDIIELKRGIRRGLEGKVRRGIYPYHPKPGYMMDRITREHVPDPERFPLLRRAWELMLTGAYTVPDVLAELTSWGYRTKKTSKTGDKPFTRSAFFEFFGDRFYAGFFEWEGELMRGTHRPMVSPEEFARVQRIMGRDLKVKPEKHVLAFTGLARCGTCGLAATGEVHTKHYVKTNRTVTYTYYHCTGRNGCRKISLSEDNFESQLVDYLASCRLSPHYVDWALKALKRDLSSRTDTDEAIERKQIETGALLEKRLKRLNDLYLNGDYTPGEYRELKEQVQGELNDIRWQSSQTEIEETRVNRVTENVLTFSRDAYERMTERDVRDKREVAKLFSASYVLTLGNLTFEPDPRLEPIRMFEPRNLEPQQIGKGDSGASDPSWYTLLELIRTSARECKRDFSPLSRKGLASMDGWDSSLIAA